MAEGANKALLLISSSVSNELDKVSAGVTSDLPLFCASLALRNDLLLVLTPGAIGAPAEALSCNDLQEGALHRDRWHGP